MSAEAYKKGADLLLRYALCQQWLSSPYEVEVSAPLCLRVRRAHMVNAVQAESASLRRELLELGITLPDPDSHE